MAQIRMPEINPVNFDAANRLRMAGQNMLLQGFGGVQQGLTDYRNAVVDRNTANAVNLLTGAKDMNDLAARQSQVQNILQQAGGDINAQDVQKAQLTMPDTLMSRQNTQNQLKQYDISQHDAPINNAIMARAAAGDFAGASELAKTLQGDASKSLSFLTGRQDAAAAERDRQAQLAISRAGLADRRAAAARSQANSIKLASLYKQLLQPGTDASIKNTAIAADQQADEATAAEKSNLLNNPKNDPGATVSKLNADSTPWYAPIANTLAYTSPLNLGIALKTGQSPAWVKGDLGDRIRKQAEGLKGFNNLTNEQQNNLIAGMGQAYQNADTFFGASNPEVAAGDWANQAMTSLTQARDARMSAKTAAVNQEAKAKQDQLRLTLMLQHPELFQ